MISSLTRPATTLTSAPRGLSSILPGMRAAAVAVAGFSAAVYADSNSLSEAAQARLQHLLEAGRQDGSISAHQYRQTQKWLTTSPCATVQQQLTAADKEALRAAVARQFAQHDVEILQSFQAGGWYVLYATAGDADTPYLFYPQHPAQAHQPLLRWSGAATFFESEAVYQQLRTEAAAMPDGLARCIAWQVTLKAHQM